MKSESDQYNYNWPKVEYNKLPLQSTSLIKKIQLKKHNLP